MSLVAIQFNQVTCTTKYIMSYPFNVIRRRALPQFPCQSQWLAVYMIEATKHIFIIHNQQLNKHILYIVQRTFSFNHLLFIYLFTSSDGALFFFIYVKLCVVHKITKWISYPSELVFLISICNIVVCIHLYYKYNVAAAVDADSIIFEIFFLL